MCFWLGLISYIIVAAMPDVAMRGKIARTNALLEELLNAQNPAACGRHTAPVNAQVLPQSAAYAPQLGAQNRYTAEDGWICGYCKTFNAPTATFCVGCGKRRSVEA